MKPIIFASLLLAAFCATSALAQQSRVGDWTIEKRSQDQHCNASRGYKDKDDETRDYAIVLTYSRQGDRHGADLRRLGVGQGRRHPQGGCRDGRCGCPEKGEVGGHRHSTMRGIFEFDQSILDKLSKAKRLTIDFEDDDDDSIEMQVPRFGEALVRRLKFCEENKK